MEYASFLEEQISLQEAEVKTMRKFMYGVLGLCLCIALYAAFTANLKENSNMDLLKFGFSILTGGLALVPRAELVKRKEKISGLRAIRQQYIVIEKLSAEEKNFIVGKLNELVGHTLNKI